MGAAEWVEYEVQLNDGTFFNINRQFGFLGKVGKTWEEIWDDPQNASIRSLRHDSTALQVGDHVFLLRIGLGPDEHEETYTVAGDDQEKSGFHVITDRINAKFPSSAMQVLSNGPLTPASLYFALENSPFRKVHEPFRIAPSDDIRFSQLVAGSVLKFRVRDRIRIRTPQPGPMGVLPPIHVAPGSPAIVVPFPPATQIVLKDTKQILIPLDLATSKLRQSSLAFNVTLPEVATKTTLQIKTGDGNVLFQEEHTSGDLISQGTHPWTWDGYTNAGVLDTEVLRGPLVAFAFVEYVKNARKEGAMQKFEGRGNLGKYIDVRIDTSAKKVAAKLHVRIVQAADDDGTLGKMADAVSKYLGLAGQTAIAMLKDRIRLSSTEFSTAQDGIRAGIAKYWSRRGVEAGRTIDPHVTIDSDTFDMSATAADPGANFVQFDVMKALSPQQRACNLGAPFDDMPILIPLSTDEEDFKETAAHEFGHSVLRDERDKVYSVTHKGSTTLTQDVLPPPPQGQTATPGQSQDNYPQPPKEIDLMKYWNPPRGFKPEFYQREVVAEDDAKGAISISRVEFFPQ